MVQLVTTEALDFERIVATPLRTDPYPFVIVDRAILPEVADELGAELPKVDRGGAIPLDELDRGPLLDKLIADLESDRFRKLMEDKFGIDLSGKEVLTTYRGMMRWKDGLIHTDTPAKTLTTLLYLNPTSDADDASLRILRSGSDLEDYVAEVPPRMGTMVVFKVTDNCWHGHKPMEGPRHSLQMNYLSGLDVKGHERGRRMLQRFKRLLFKPR